MLHDIIVEKLVQEKYLSFDLLSIIRQVKKKRGGGSHILDWTYANGGGVIKMRTVCNRGGGGV